MGNETSYDYLISYAWADRDWVDGRLRPAMEGAGLSVHPAGLLPPRVPSAAEFETLKAAIQDSRRILLVLTPAYLAQGARHVEALLTGLYGPEADDWPAVPIVLRPVAPVAGGALIGAAAGALYPTDPHLVEQIVAKLYRPPPPMPEPEPPLEILPKKPLEPGEPAPRYANIDLLDGETGERCDPARPLATDTSYHLRINIGKLRATNVIVTAHEHPFPDDVLPETEEGHWLDVVVTSDAFSVASGPYTLFLPESGDSWVCGCPRDGAHACAPGERHGYLHVPLTSPGDPGEATLRMGFYYENNLLQSQLVTAQVGVEPPVGEWGIGARITRAVDFSLTQALTHVARLPPRTLNIMTNDNGDGSHRFVLVNKQEVLHDRLEAATLNDAMLAARKELHDTHRELLIATEVEDWPDGTQRVKRYPKYGGNKLKKLGTVTQAKTKKEFEEDLRRLAALGWWLYGTLFERHAASRKVLQELLKERATIQTCRAKDGGSPLLFPWALVYDIYIDSDVSKHPICPVLDDWKPGTPLADPETTKCPRHDDVDHRMDLICPFGFWGIKHVIEQPPPMPPGRSLELAIKLGGASVEMAVGLSLDLDRPGDHVDALRKALSQKVQIVDEDSKDDILRLLGRKGLAMVYFFCHGRRLRLTPGGRPIPFLEVGQNEPLTTGDITKWQDFIWPADHWQRTSPLVVINGCHTAELTPDAMVSFVDKFIDARASGVIGTEVTVEQGFAAEAALELFKHLLEQDDSGQYRTVGDAMRRMRLEFLSRGNLMGLAYTPYCSASLHLA